MDTTGTNTTTMMVTMNRHIKGHVMFMLAVCMVIMTLHQWILFTTVVPLHENVILISGRRSMAFVHEELSHHQHLQSALSSSPSSPSSSLISSICGPTEEMPWYDTARGRLVLQNIYETVPPTMRYHRTDDLLRMMLQGLLQEAAERQERLVTLFIGQTTSMGTITSSDNNANNTNTNNTFMGLQQEDENRQWWLPITVMNAGSYYHHRQGQSSSKSSSLRGNLETTTTTVTTTTDTTHASSNDECSHIVIPWTLRSTSNACTRVDSNACGTMVNMLERVFTTATTNHDSPVKEEAGGSWKNQRQRSRGPVVWDLDTAVTKQLPLILGKLSPSVKPALIRFQVPSSQPSHGTTTVTDGDNNDSNVLFLIDLRKRFKKAGYFVLPTAAETTEDIETFLALLILVEESS